MKSIYKKVLINKELGDGDDVKIRSIIAID